MRLIFIFVDSVQGCQNFSQWVTPGHFGVKRGNFFEEKDALYSSFPNEALVIFDFFFFSFSTKDCKKHFSCSLFFY